MIPAAAPGLGVTDESGVRAVEGPPGAPLMRRPQDATLLVEACFSAGIRGALLYPENLTPSFFDLSSGEAGQILDKIRRYQLRLAIVCAAGTVRFSSRFPEILADDLRVFDTRDQARRWLGEKAAGDVSVRLRPAALDDLDLLRRWDEQPHVVESDPNDDWNWQAELARSPDWREQLIAEVDGRPIGFLQIIDPAREESHYWGDVRAGLRAIDIWIGEAADLGRGYGTQMMRLALARCFAPPEVSAVIIDPLASNTRAIRFYERLGFRFVEHRRFGDDECDVYQLTRADYVAANRFSTESRACQTRSTRHSSS